MNRLPPLAVAMLLVPVVSGAADKMTRETFGSGGQTRTYYLLVPESAKKAGSAPLVVLLHGSGRDGKSLVEKWEPLAKKEGVVIVGPDAVSPDGWRVPQDGPEFLYNLVEMLAVQLDIDRRRVYLFGHSAGAGHALVMALLESEYFAAVGIHAGAEPASGSIKSQAPSSNELPTPKCQNLCCPLGFGRWECLGIWSLELGN